MEFKTKYITEDEFLQFSGENLSAILGDNDNPSDKANAFLYRNEERVATYLDSSFFRKVDKEYKTFTDYQKKHYKLALLEQALYVLKNGDISVDSGYDQEQGIVARNLKSLVIAPNCKRHLMLCGLWCTHIASDGGRGFLSGWLH